MALSKRHGIRVEKNKAPLKRFDPQDIITLYAGEDASKKPLSVHKEVACYYSPVFKAAFNSQFMEGETQSYTIEDVGARVVRMLIHWMYNQELDITPTGGPLKSLNDRLIVELWVLADKLLIPTLQNLAIKQLEKLRKRYRTTSTNCLEYVYERTGPGSPLRRLFVHQCAFNVASARFHDRPEHFPKEMLLELVTLLSETVGDERKKKEVEERDMDDYEAGGDESDDEESD